MEIRGLTITQPWAQLVVQGHKAYETRGWGTRYRGWLAIHAGKRSSWHNFHPVYDERFFAALGREAKTKGTLPRGVVVGVVKLVDMIATDRVVIDATERDFGDFQPGRMAWLLESPMLLEEPIPCKGALGLWALPADILAQLEEFIEGGRR